jgi:hypothetical protein
MKEWRITEIIICREVLKHLRKICLSAALSTTNPTCIALELSLGFCNGKLAANHLSYDIALSDQVLNGRD